MLHATTTDYAFQKKPGQIWMGMKGVKLVDYSDYRQIPQPNARKLIWVNICVDYSDYNWLRPKKKVPGQI